jgi:hypothetical protein
MAIAAVTGSGKCMPNGAEKKRRKMLQKAQPSFRVSNVSEPLHQVEQ